MYLSPLHYRPDTTVLGDVIPFYWNGEYHIFYLHPGVGVDWNHIVTKDFTHWRELPTALKPDGPANGPDGMCMFTGSVMEKDGIFHCYYTGHNPNNPDGLELIMHATSTDLIHWTKHPADILRPDGLIYRIGKKSNPASPWVSSDWNFRDPYVSYNQDEKCYWMLFLGDDPQTGRNIQGLATSRDLQTWQFQKPLDSPIGQECPDMFKIGDTWYLIGGGRYLWSKHPRGPYVEAENPLIDSPFIYAGKSMFDGKRHIWTGWLWDRSPRRDDGVTQWGGTQCLPRELYAGPNGLLYCKPIDEVTAFFKKTVLDIAHTPAFTDNSATWKITKSGISGQNATYGSQCVFDAPANYMMECTFRMDPSSVIEMTIRENGANGYKLILNPAKHQASLKGRSFSVDRNARIDTDKPVNIKAFALGTMIEVFVNDQYALSCRAYDYPSGNLGFSIFGGKVELTGLRIGVEK
jgi:sucrose-6-phosphate hydrolase SacC (GH32 family)